jgi:hypothetical protein
MLGKEKCRMGQELEKYGSCLSIGICFMAKNWQTQIALCAGTLSWYKIQP